MKQKQPILSEFGSGLLGLAVLGFFGWCGWALISGGFHGAVDFANTHQKDATTFIEGNWWVGEHRTCYGNIEGTADNSNLGCSSPSGRSGDWSSFPIHVLPVEYHGSIDRHDVLVEWDCQRKEASLVCRDKNPAPAPQATAVPPSTEPTSEDAAFAQSNPAYMTAVKNKLVQGWDLKDVDSTVPSGAKAVISFHIGDSGYPGHPTILTTSGYSSLDQACLNTEGRVLSFDPPSKSGGLNVSFTCVHPGSGQ